MFALRGTELSPLVRPLVASAHLHFAVIGSDACMRRAKSPCSLVVQKADVRQRDHAGRAALSDDGVHAPSCYTPRSLKKAETTTAVDVIDTIVSADISVAGEGRTGSLEPGKKCYTVFTVAPTATGSSRETTPPCGSSAMLNLLVSHEPLPPCTTDELRIRMHSPCPRRRAVPQEKVHQTANICMEGRRPQTRSDNFANSRPQVVALSALRAAGGASTPPERAISHPRHGQVITMGPLSTEKWPRAVGEGRRATAGEETGPLYGLSEGVVGSQECAHVPSRDAPALNISCPFQPLCGRFDDVDIGSLHTPGEMVGRRDWKAAHISGDTRWRERTADAAEANPMIIRSFSHRPAKMSSAGAGQLRGPRQSTPLPVIGSGAADSIAVNPARETETLSTETPVVVPLKQVIAKDLGSSLYSPPPPPESPRRTARRVFSPPARSADDSDESSSMIHQDGHEAGSPTARIKGRADCARRDRCKHHVCTGAFFPVRPVSRRGSARGLGIKRNFGAASETLGVKEVSGVRAGVGVT